MFVFVVMNAGNALKRYIQLCALLLLLLRGILLLCCKEEGDPLSPEGATKRRAASCRIPKIIFVCRITSRGIMSRGNLPRRCRTGLKEITLDIFLGVASAA